MRKKIKILPREPLTYKAKQSIMAYALARCKGFRNYVLLIKYTLEAERMPRVRLYEWLEKHSYKWDSLGWSKPEKEENQNGKKG